MLSSIDELAVPHLARVAHGLLERDPGARLTAAGVLAGLRPARAAETDAPPLATAERLSELFRGSGGDATSLRDAVRGVGDLHPAVVRAAVDEGEKRASGASDAAGPSAAQLGAINLYSREHTQGAARSLYHRLNAALRDDSVDDFEPLRPYARLLVAALAALPEAGQRCTAYRWIRGRVDGARYPVGGEVLWAGFSSCSAPDGAGQLSFDQFGQPDGDGGERTLFIITLPEGTGAKHVTGYSRFAGEDEVILAPGSRLRVTGAIPGGGGLEIILLELLGVLQALL